MNPEFIIADEPISALDVSVRAQVLKMCIRDRLCAVLAASTVLSGCGGKKTTEGGSTAQAGNEAGKNENGKGEDGGKPVVYKELYSGEVATLNYLVSASEADFKTAAYCIDTLIEYDSEGKIRPGQATE